MSTLSVGTIQSNTTSPPTINNSAGTAIGTFCRAWVNFNGTGTVAIRASFNVTSITDNGSLGDYTVNFTTAMPDANYTALLSSVGASTNEMSRIVGIKGVTASGATTKTTTQLNVISGQGWAAGLLDNAEMNVAIFR
jgi:hypothetical protein